MGTAEVELIELVANDFRAALGGAMAVELLVKETDPAAKDFFGFGGRMWLRGGGRLGLGSGHMCMDDKPTGWDAARVVTGDGGLF